MITLQLTPAQAGLLVEAMKNRIDRSNQKLKYWRSHPEAKAPNGYELTEAHRQGMLAALIAYLESELAPSGENHASKNDIRPRRQPVGAIDQATN